MGEEARRRIQCRRRTGVADLGLDSRQTQVFQDLGRTPRDVNVENPGALHLLLGLGTPQPNLAIVDVRFRRFRRRGCGRSSSSCRHCGWYLSVVLY